MVVPAFATLLSILKDSWIPLFFAHFESNFLPIDIFNGFFQASWINPFHVLKQCLVFMRRPFHSRKTWLEEGKVLKLQEIVLDVYWCWKLFPVLLGQFFLRFIQDFKNHGFDGLAFQQLKPRKQEKQKLLPVMTRKIFEFLFKNRPFRIIKLWVVFECELNYCFSCWSRSAYSLTNIFASWKMSAFLRLFLNFWLFFSKRDWREEVWLRIGRKLRDIEDFGKNYHFFIFLKIFSVRFN